MKKVVQIAVIAAIAFVTACGSSVDDVAGNDTVAKQNTQATEQAIDFSKIQFASKKDTSCGMPLSAGLEDTLKLEDKVYGFCSKECKDAFVKQLIAQHKR